MDLDWWQGEFLGDLSISDRHSLLKCLALYPLRHER